MNRVLRPIGKVSTALRRHGYRQQAIVLIDNVQVPHVAILSKQVGDKVKFEGHWIDANGELHKTNAFIDAKKAAGAILAKRELALAEAAPAPKPPGRNITRTGVKPDAKAKRAARRQHSSKPTAQSAGAMIECKGCGTRHADDEMCPE